MSETELSIVDGNLAIVNMAMDHLGEPEVSDLDDPIGELPRRAVRRLQDAIEHVLIHGPFDDARAVARVAGEPRNLTPRDESIILSANHPVIFTPEYRTTYVEQSFDREQRYRYSSRLPGDYGGLVWHVGGYANGWKVTNGANGEKFLIHNFVEPVQVVYNRMIDGRQMNIALRECVAVKLAMYIAPPKSGRQNISAQLNQMYESAMRLAATADRGGEVESLHSPWLLNALYGGYGDGGGFGGGY